MLRHYLTATASAVVITFSGASSATVVLTDDVVFGTDSVIRDVDNGRDFLRLEETVGFGGYDAVEAALGTTFAGWSIAVKADLEALGVSAGVTHDSADPAQVAIAEMLRDWFCVTCQQLTSTHHVARGLVSDFSSGGPLGSRVAFTIGTWLTPDPDHVDFRESGWALGDWNEEIYLVRSTGGPTPAPEPASLALLGLGVLGVGWRRRRHVG